MPDPPSLKSAGIPWLRGEPRQCGLKAPGYVAFGWSRGSAGIVRIAWLRRPWLQQASAGHPWPVCARSPHCRVFRPVNLRGFVDAGSGSTKAMPAEAANTTVAKDVAARGFRPSGSRLCGARMYRARVLEQDAEPRGGRNPLAAAAPARSEAFALAAADPCPSVRRTTTKKAGTPLPAFRGCSFPSPGYGKQATSSRSPSSFSASIRVGM